MRTATEADFLAVGCQDAMYLLYPNGLSFAVEDPQGLVGVGGITFDDFMAWWGMAPGVSAMRLRPLIWGFKALDVRWLQAYVLEGDTVGLRFAQRLGFQPRGRVGRDERWWTRMVMER